MVVIYKITTHKIAHTSVSQSSHGDLKKKAEIVSNRQ